MASPSSLSKDAPKKKLSHLRIQQLLPPSNGGSWQRGVSRSTPTSPTELTTTKMTSSAIGELSHSVNSLLNIHYNQVDPFLQPRLIVTDQDGNVTSSSGGSSAASSRSASPSPSGRTSLMFVRSSSSRKYTEPSTAGGGGGEQRSRSKSQQHGQSGGSTGNLLTAVLNRTLRKK